jgi:glycosyltransferase involved in cell wall biosynthesis
MINSKPKISIVTACLNSIDYIEETIKSILNQNYPNLEYIIIDAGSKDETCEIIKKYEKYLAYWVSEPDKGQTDAINKGFRKTTGVWFNWLNSDDFYEPGVFQIIAKLHNQHKSLKVIAGLEYGFLQNNPGNKINHLGSIVHKTTEETIYTGIIDQPCTFFKRDYVKAFFPLSEDIHYVMDRELWLNFLASYGVADIIKVDHYFTNFRLHESSKTVSQELLFEKEFEAIRVVLLQTLSAPDWLIEFHKQKAGDFCNLSSTLNDCQFKGVLKTTLLSIFVYHYALYHYVHNKIAESQMAMRWISKNGFLDKKHVPLFAKSAILPSHFIFQMKRIKSKYF